MVNLKIKDIKITSKKHLTHPYWRNVFMSLLIVISTAGVLNSILLTLSGKSTNSVGNYGWLFIKYIIRFYNPNFLIPPSDNSTIVMRYQMLDSLCSLSTSILTTNISFPLYIGYSSLSAVEANTINAIWFAILGCLLYFAIIVFLLHPINIGARYHFLKRIKNIDKTEEEKNAILEAGFNRYYLNIVITRLLKTIVFYLSCLTIVGGFIMYFSYYLVDYIIMDNPSLNPIEALRLSRKMMYGNKMKLFLLMLSFIGWEFLSLFTFGLLLPLFVNPYKELSYANFYLEVKENFKEANPFVYKLSYLKFYEENSKSFFLRSNINYNVPYQIVDYVLIFFIVSFAGWCWEVLYNFIQTFTFANRGTLWGPILPIYGTGAILALVLLKRFRNVPWLSFLSSIVVCLTIEYFTSYFLEKTKGIRYWNYDSMPFNLNGRICLFGGLLFGVGCLFAIYFVGPALFPFLHKFTLKQRWIVAGIFISLILVDIIVSKFYPNFDGMEIITNPTTQTIFSLKNIKLDDILSNALCKLTFVPLDCHV